MRHEYHAAGFGIKMRPVQIEDAAFIVWLRNQDYVKGRVGDSAQDLASQQAWIARYFDRPDDYYFVIETSGGIRLGTQGIYDIQGSRAEWGRYILRPETPAALPASMLAFDFSFGQLGLRELVAHCVSSNQPVRSLTRKLGFRETGISKAAQLIGGEPVDLVEQILKVDDWAPGRKRLVPAAGIAETHIRTWEQTQLSDLTHSNTAKT